jgi:thioredoxin-like negative regulator of GroEL
LCSDFAVKFGLNSLPTVVVISQTKKKFVNLVGMFDDKSIASFLDGVLSGKHGTSSFQDLPQVCAALSRSRPHATFFALIPPRSSTNARAVR